MAATDHTGRRRRGRRLALGGLVAVVLVATLGPCRRGDGLGELPALPAPAAAGLGLEAEVRPAPGGRPGQHELEVEVTLHVAKDVDGVVVLPSRSQGGSFAEWGFLVHRARGPDGGIVLWVGRGAERDPDEPLPPGPRGMAAPAPTPSEPVLALPGTTRTGSGRTTPWAADGAAAPDPVTTAAVAAADELRVCVWGTITSVEVVTASPPASVDGEEVICVDVPGLAP